RQEGAREKDVSFSATASMLLELGLRVHEAQMERKESAFNQTEFNKLLLECVVKTQSSVAKILGILSSLHRLSIESFVRRFLCIRWIVFNKNMLVK
ncbi:conjugal transfer relaxosome DNA-binding protein TraM, partial [Escherichia coli]